MSGYHVDKHVLFAAEGLPAENSPDTTGCSDDPSSTDSASGSDSTDGVAAAVALWAPVAAWMFGLVLVLVLAVCFVYCLVAVYQHVAALTRRWWRRRRGQGQQQQPRNQVGRKKINFLGFCGVNDVLFAGLSCRRTDWKLGDKYRLDDVLNVHLLN